VVEISRLGDNQHTQAQVVGPTNWLLLLSRKYSWHAFLIHTKCQSVAGRIRSTKNSNDTIGNRSHNLPACDTESSRCTNKYIRGKIRYCSIALSREFSDVKDLMKRTSNRRRSLPSQQNDSPTRNCILRANAMRYLVRCKPTETRCPILINKDQVYNHNYKNQEENFIFNTNLGAGTTGLWPMYTGRQLCNDIEVIE
jgi:hypothetical protein